MPTIPPSRIAPPPVQKQKRGASLSAWPLWLLLSGCAASGVTAVSVPGVGSGSRLTVPDVPSVAPAGPASTRIDPRTDGNAPMPPGLAALRDELQRGMTELKAKGNPPPYYIGYEVHDRSEIVGLRQLRRAGAVVVAARAHPGHRRARRRLQARLDARHPLDDFDFSSAIDGHAVALPLSDDPRRAAHGRLARDRPPLQGGGRAAGQDQDPAHAEGRRRGSLRRLLAREAGHLHRAAGRDSTVDVPAWEEQIRAAVGALSRAGRDPTIRR